MSKGLSKLTDSILGCLKKERRGGTKKVIRFIVTEDLSLCLTEQREINVVEQKF